MFRILKKSLHIVPLLILAVVLPLFVGCSTGVDDLHPNKGPGLYEQNHDITVSTPSTITFKVRTARHDTFFLNNEKYHVSQAVVFDANGRNRFHIASERSETGLEVTVEIEPTSSAITEIRSQIFGYLNGNRIHEFNDGATIRNAKHYIVMGLGEFWK